MSAIRIPAGRSRVYLKSGPTQRLQMTESLAMAAEHGGKVVAGINGANELVEVPVHNVESVVHKPAIAPQAGTMDGRRIEIIGARSLVLQAEHEAKTGLSDLGMDDDAQVVVDLLPDPADQARHVAIVAQDMASALVVLFDPDKDDGDLLWVNPAAPADAIDLTVMAAKMLIVAEQLTMEANTPEEREIEREKVRAANNGLNEDQANAVAWLEQRGVIDTAIATAGEAFVRAYLAELSFNQTVKVVTQDGLTGEITGFNASTNVFEIMRNNDGADLAVVDLTEITRIISVDDTPIESNL